MNTRDELELWIQTACLLEATARKPGNVHPSASFADVCYQDFVDSAAVAAPILAEAPARGVGQSILDAVTATRRRVGCNTNLGIVLLLAPLAAVPAGDSLATGIGPVLGNLTVHDARLVYRAIRTAHPGGLGTSDVADVQDDPPGTLVEVMALAADRDLVAAQFANGFDTVLTVGVPTLLALSTNAGQPIWPDDWEQIVIGLHLHLMSHFPDSLIARKCGAETARSSAQLAQSVLDAGWPGSVAGEQHLDSLDRWLRADGNRRNPGTTADLVTACLFAALRDRVLTVPAAELIEAQLNSSEEP